MRRHGWTGACRVRTSPNGCGGAFHAARDTPLSRSSTAPRRTSRHSLAHDPPPLHRRHHLHAARRGGRRQRAGARRRGTGRASRRDSTRSRRTESRTGPGCRRATSVRTGSGRCASGCARSPRPGRSRGIVVTHGTDTIEETAYILARTLPAGASRWRSPARCAPRATTAGMDRGICSTPPVWPRDPSSAGRGAMVVFAGRIFAGETAVKAHATDLEAFSAPHAAPVGRVEDGCVLYATRHAAARPRTVQPDGLSRPAWRWFAHRGRRRHHAGPGAAGARRRRDRGVRQRQHAAGRGAGGAALDRRRQAGGAGQPLPAWRGHAALRIRRRRRPHGRHGRDSGGPADTFAGADGAACSRSRPASPTASDERPRRARRFPTRCSRSRARSRPPGTRPGAWAARCATRCSATPTPTTTSPPPRRPTQVRRCSAARRRRREVRHGGRDRPPPGAARGDHLPARRHDRWPARGGGLRRVARGRSGPARLHDQRHRLPSRCGTSGGTPSAARRPPQRRPPRGRRARRAVPRGLPPHPARASGSRPGSVSPSSPRPGPPRSRRRRGLAQLSAERVRDEWFKGLRTARSVAELVELWIRSGAAERWIPELCAVPVERAARAGAAAPAAAGPGAADRAV